MLLFYTRNPLSVQLVTGSFVKVHTTMDEERVYRTRVSDGWLGERSSSNTRERHQFTRLNNSELVAGVHYIKQEQNYVNLEIKADKEEFGTRFGRPQLQTPHTGATPLQYYPKILQSDVFSFLEPAVDQSSQLHYQYQLHEDMGAIYPSNFDTPSPVSMPAQPTLAGDTTHDGDMLHMGNVLSVTKQEVLEFQPSCYTQGKHLLFCGVY